MKNNNISEHAWKWAALFILTILSVLAIFPDRFMSSGKESSGDKSAVRLGLDLAGGTSFTLCVDQDALKEKLIGQDPTLAAPEKEDELAKRINELLVENDDRIVEVIRRRVDGMGTTEPVIQSIRKNHRLVVQLPGANEKQSAEAETLLKSAACLEFRLVHPNNDAKVKEIGNAAPEGYVSRGNGVFTRAANYAEVSSKPGYFARLAKFKMLNSHWRFMLEERVDPVSHATEYRALYVSSKNELKKGAIRSAQVDTDITTGKIKINFSLDNEGTVEFGDCTKNNIGRRLAIILDNTLYSAPNIQSAITGGSGEITGDFSPAEAKKLANVLKAGVLPAPMKVLAKEHVSPTVGADAINKGLWAAAIGFCVIALFMAIYYSYCGMVANVALVLDFLLLPAALVLVANTLGLFAREVGMTEANSLTKMLTLPVLTMPGIAGLVLSLGMAVDANVLIFERIREEFIAGANAGTSIKNGYARAFSAIFDSNLTTIITGIILFVVGTGPVRGFAITLVGGVIISMFTALVVTRLVFDYTVEVGGRKPFKMLQAFKNPNFDFVKCGKVTTLISAVIIAITLGFFAWHCSDANLRNGVLAVDLTGGTMITYDQLTKLPADDEIRNALKEFDNAPVIQVAGGKVMVKTSWTTENMPANFAAEKGNGVDKTVTSLLAKAIPDAGFNPDSGYSSEEVGSMVGKDLIDSGIKAVIFSLIAILVYIGFRFKFGFGLGALVALFHDALISLGLYTACGHQVSLIVITAILTIVGYSVNDTVVIFDRVREDLKKDPRADLKTIVNRSINQTLSRTAITSATTFFAVSALFAFGSGSIFDFALTMMFGVVAGTYSSIFIAAPVMMWWYHGKRPDFSEDSEKAS